MYRILKADKDGYVTNKLIFARGSSLTSSIDANVGQAGTIDIFKLYNETPVPSGTSGIEVSRGLIHFDLDPLRAITSSILNPLDPSFKAYLSMKNVYGGQTVPSNFVLVVNPLGKDFTEGRGNDVIGYRDLDAVNWLTASIDGASITTWTSGGIIYGGDTADVNADYYLSGSSILGYVPLSFSQSFARGDEDLFVDVTAAVSAAITGKIPDYGFRIAYSGSQETDAVTRFVKRFSSRQSRNTNLHPTLIVKYNDTFIDNQTSAFFDYPNKIGTYFTPFDSPTNFTNANGSPVVGSGSLFLELKAQQSQYVTATTYSFSHQATINYTSASWVYFSASFTGSQIAIGGLNQSGSYYADVYLPSNITGLSGVLNASGEATFTTVWKSLDNATIFSTGPSITFRPLASKNNVGSARNYATNITNLKDVYIDSDVARLRVFVLDYDPTLTSFYLPYKGSSKIFKESYWRVIDPYTKETLIPFDTTDKGTAMSADGEGMYFDLYMSDLPVNRPLEIELLFKEFGSNYLVENQGFLFKVVKS
jgi:hypothetical protein